MMYLRYIDVFGIHRLPDPPIPSSTRPCARLWHMPCDMPPSMRWAGLVAATQPNSPPVAPGSSRPELIRMVG